MPGPEPTKLLPLETGQAGPGSEKTNKTRIPSVRCWGAANPHPAPVLRPTCETAADQASHCSLPPHLRRRTKAQRASPSRKERQSGLQQVVEQLQPCVRRGLKDVGIPRRHEVLRVRGLGGEAQHHRVRGRRGSFFYRLVDYHRCSCYLPHYGGLQPLISCLWRDSNHRLPND